jgi:hypothetical protein
MKCQGNIEGIARSLSDFANILHVYIYTKIYQFGLAALDKGRYMLFWDICPPERSKPSPGGTKHKGESLMKIALDQSKGTTASFTPSQRFKPVVRFFDPYDLKAGEQRI